jgi:hypothetical protein
MFINNTTSSTVFFMTLSCDLILAQSSTSGVAIGPRDDVPADGFLMWGSSCFRIGKYISEM